jgi:hypothetical protein
MTLGRSVSRPRVDTSCDDVVMAGLTSYSYLSASMGSNVAAFIAG